MDIEKWTKEYNIVKRIEDLLDWQNDLEKTNYSDVFLYSERFFSSTDAANNIDSVTYDIWHRKKGEEYKKYYPTLSNKSSKKRISLWRTFFKDEKIAWYGARKISCSYDKKLDKVVMVGGHDFGYVGGNNCHLTVKCEEKYFFDETKKVLEYWNKLPKQLGSEEWMAWAKKLVITVEENPHLVVTTWWREIDASESKDHDENDYDDTYDEIFF